MKHIHAKYKLYPVQKLDSLDIHIGLYVWEEKYGDYDLKFTFLTHNQAEEFIETLENYPKFIGQHF